MRASHCYAPLGARVIVIKGFHLAELRTAVSAVLALAGLAAASFTDPATPGIVVKALHINALRSALDAAMGALGLPTGGWTIKLAPAHPSKQLIFRKSQIE